jgi:hypothetical protein
MRMLGRIHAHVVAPPPYSRRGSVNQNALPAALAGVNPSAMRTSYEDHTPWA